jgi:predicted MFS family arabinose efflux permease
MGLLMISFSVASVLGIPFSLTLANHYDWHSPFMFLGVVSTFISVIISLKMPSMRSHLKGPGATHDPFATLKHLFHNPSQVMALVFIFTVVFGQFSMISFMSPSLVANAALPAKNLSLVYLLGGVVSMISSPLFGRLSDKFGKKLIFYISASISLLPIHLITHLGPTPIVFLLALTSSFFFTMGGRMVPAVAIMSTAVTPRFRASFLSVSSSTQQLGSSLASYVAGLIIVRGSEGQLLNYDKVGWITMTLTLISLFLVSKVKAQEGDTN